MLSAIIVDDMPQAVQVLQNDLQDYCPNVQIIGTANSVVEAAKLLRQKTPDLLFLDIMLGDGTGFDLLEILPNIKSKIIFTTASDEHAIKAFRFAALDYLLKPIDPNLLQEAVEKGKKQITNTPESIDLLKETIKYPNALPQRITLHTQERIVVLEIDRIIRCKSEGNNTMFYLDSGDKIFVTKTLKHFENLLQDHSFMRVHQSHLIHLKYIQEYVRKEGGYLKMKNGEIVPISIRKKGAVIGLLDKLGQ